VRKGEERKSRKWGAKKQNEMKISERVEDKRRL
jgi:hypothetical protein